MSGENTGKRQNEIFHILLMKFFWETELEPEPAWEKIVGAGAALKVDGSETLLT